MARSLSSRLRLGLGCALACAIATPALADPAPGPAAAAIADASRPAADREKDAARNPAAMLALAGVKPGDHVIDFWTGSGYWARLFGKIVGDKGHVVAYVPAEVTGFKSHPLDIAKAMAAEPGRSNIEVISDPVADYPPAQYHNTFDEVFIFENYHDLYNSFLNIKDVGAVNKAVFALLKPGGVYVIVDHAATPGSGTAHTEDQHRIDPAKVRADVEAAGFVFDGQSDALANPADPKTAIVFDASIRGQTDRFAWRFRKPK